MATTYSFEQQDERNVPTSDKKSDLHATAVRHANEAWVAEQINIAEGREDQRFAFGEQWPVNDKVERDRERRPSITVNRLPQFKRQVTGDIRKDTPSSKVLPSRNATKKKAEILTGMIRNIEQQSNAKAAYVQAVENAVDVGMGVWRILTEYESDNAFEQVIRIERIQDPFGALCDPTARKPDKSDARFWFVFDDMAEEEFKRQWPKATLDNFPSPPEGGMIWRMDKTIRVAEYWYKEEVTRTLELLEDGTTRYKDEGDDDVTADQEEERDEAQAPPQEEAAEGLAAAEPILDAGSGMGRAGSNAGSLAGAATANLAIDDAQPANRVINTREVKTFKVMSVLMSGRETLEEPQEWAGRYIPLVPVIGEEARIDGRTLRKGMVRDAKGPQQVYNYMRTAAAEFVGKQPSAPFVGTVKQFAGYEHIWQEAGSANHSYLPYNVDPAAPGAPQRSMPPTGATGLDQQAVIAAGDIEAVIGIYKSNLGAPSNETSGRAIIARQKEGDTGSFYFLDNLRQGLAFSAKILLDLIPKIYDTARVVRTLKEDGDHEMVPINQHMAPGAMPPGMEPEDLSQEVREALNDLSIGEYDVVVSSGPGYASKRQEASESMTNFIQAFPPAAPYIGDLIAKAQDWPGSEEIAERLKAVNPLFQEKPGPPPDVVAKKEKDDAQAALYRAQAEGQEIVNVETGVSIIQVLQQMHMEMSGLKQALDAMSAPPGAEDQVGAPSHPAADGAPQPSPGAPGPASPIGPVPPPSPDIGEFEPMPEPDPLLLAIKGQGDAMMRMGQDIRAGMSELARAQMADTEMETSRGTKVTARKVPRLN